MTGGDSPHPFFLAPEVFLRAKRIWFQFEMKNLLFLYALIVGACAIFFGHNICRRRIAALAVTLRFANHAHGVVGIDDYL
jgi:hypothetical protein